MNSIDKTPFGSMTWFMGVVEDINDPKKMNRIRVRCIGFHSDSRSDMPHDTLPWAPVISGTNQTSSPMLLPSDWVIGFFLDGKEAQQPVVFGSIAGIPEEKDATSGFSDPNDIYPRKVGVGTNSPLARGETEDTPVEWKKSNIGPGEPLTPYAAEYPHNHVMHTDGSNIIELDDTPGSERVHIFHKSGSFVEMHPDGKVVIRSVAEMYEACFADRTLYVAGDLKIKSAGDISIEAGGDLKLTAKGSVKIASGGLIALGAGTILSLIGKGVAFLNGATVQLRAGANQAGSADTVEKKSITPYK